MKNVYTKSKKIAAATQKIIHIIVNSRKGIIFAYKW